MFKKFYALLLIIHSFHAMNTPLSPLETKFLKAAGAGNDALIEECLSQNVNINVCDKNGETALYLAAYHRRWFTISFLLQQPSIEIDVQSKTADKKLTVFHHVCYSVTPEKEPLRTEVIKKLIGKKANLNILDGYGETPLVRLLGQKVPTELIEYMIDAGAKLTWSESGSVCSPLTISSRKSPDYTLAILKSFDIKLSDIQQAAAECWKERNNKLHRNAELNLIRHYFNVMCALGYVEGNNKEWRASRRLPFNRIPLVIAKRIAYYSTKNAKKNVCIKK